MASDERESPGGNDKPFACHEPGCGMKFVNEDHLLVHKMKHQMSLTLTPGTGKLLSFSLAADQTPTPTKFLRNCEEIGLFNELSVAKNPFDDAFKAAADDIKVGKRPSISADSLPLPGPTQNDDVLNTPQPRFIFKREDPPRTPTPPAPIPLEKMEPPAVVPITPQPGFPTQPEYIPLPGPMDDTGSTVSSRLDDEDGPSVAKRPREDSMTSTGTMEIVVEEQQELIIQEDGLVEEVSSVASYTQLASPPAHSYTAISSTSVAAAPMSVMSTIGAGPTAHSPINLASSPVGTVVGQALPTFVGGQLIKPAPQFLIQVMVQTPSGETVPVHIPAALGAGQSQVTAMQKVLVAPAVTTAPAGSSPCLVSSTTGGAASSATKQKLKAALQQNSQQTSGMAVMAEAIDRVTAATAASPGSRSTASYGGTSLLNKSLLHQSVASPPEVEIIDADTSSSAASPGPRLFEEDTDERRQKFLERNRAAAARCRQKKKQWINNLEGKAEELMGVNNKLQAEITSLRNEVAQLKMLLLAHKDCPVMKQQQMLGQISLCKVSDVKTEVRVNKVLPNHSSGATSSAEAIATSVLSSMATAVPSALPRKPEYKMQIVNIPSPRVEPVNLKMNHQTNS